MCTHCALTSLAMGVYVSGQVGIRINKAHILLLGMSEILIWEGGIGGERGVSFSTV